MSFFEGAEYIESWSPQDILRWAWEQFGPRAAIGTSFQGAGLVTIDLARQAGLDFPVFSLDTDLLYTETLQTWKRLEEFWGIRIERLRPDLSISKQASQFGPNLWDTDPDTCCTLRKVLPLQSKLRQLDCWITGLRRQQSEGRAGIAVLELYALEPERDLTKLNPLASWSREQVWDYIKARSIPFNPLLSRGYSSIGCIPCTKPTGMGNSERAGRWTGFNKTECGIHTFLPKKQPSDSPSI